MFFCKVLILVEGHEDISYLSSYLHLTGLISEFRKYGCHIVPVEGKHKLVKPLAMAKLLDIPVYALFDCDTDKELIEDEGRRNAEVTNHKKDNKAIFSILGYTDQTEWPDNDVILDNITAWKTNLTKTVMNELGTDLKKYEDKAAAFYGNAGGLKKNPLGIAKTLELAWSEDVKSEILFKLTKRIIEFAKQTTTA